MRSSKNKFIVPFEGLKVGFHDFEFDITDEFFEDLEYSIIKAGKLLVEMELEKKETMLIANFVVDGNVDVECARCNDPLEEYIYGEYRIVFKFGTEISDDENLIVLEPNEYELHLAPIIYELMTISLPTRSVHDDGDCNEEMIALIDEYSIVEEEDLKEDDDLEDDNDDDDNDDDDDIDPRWSALKNLN
ncbi:Uncharacterized metal-binding protein YceD, DUF177 family [Lishizhenia tianjinensis]|uniref:Uncharacterized metal-binding protein YceD, DUF177 family n=1 Tax=Lishizhenia tianjinensis TaxID=477690 RepID=A0A1I7BGD3_9FLAO|nr:YceD family protein [Lishizhenia tianjinensis]SFT86230.1 Uncharacterized metal-binding protein YceD, DUF177 family [Lishizhenia tianjinensis]